MAPPTTKPRLRDLDPARFADGVRDALAAHIHALAFRYDGLGAVTLDIGSGQNGVWLAAQQLALYAREGRGCEDAGGPMEYVQSVAEALYTRAGDVGGYDVPDLDDDADPDTWPGLVIRAALARERVMRGIEEIGTADLAVLGSISQRQASVLVREREIVSVQRSDPARVRTDEARRWLAARGVAGF